jgi:hypothetical protein
MWLLVSLCESDETGPLYWSNADGWVDELSADVFSDSEVNNSAWIPLNSAWVRRP